MSIGQYFNLWCVDDDGGLTEGLTIFVGVEHGGTVDSGRGLLLFKWVQGIAQFLQKSVAQSIKTRVENITGPHGEIKVTIETAGQSLGRCS